MLLVTNVINELSETFEEFWTSDPAKPVDRLVSNPFESDIDWSPEDDWGDKLDVDQSELLNKLEVHTRERVNAIYKDLHAYAQDESNYLPEVRQIGRASCRERV